MEPTKSVPELKASISQHAKQIQNKVSATSKDLSTLTKSFFQKDSDMTNAFKDNTAQDLKNVQATYAKKEEKVMNYLHPGGSTDQTAKEYERILQDNISKLKQIALADFNSCQENSKNLTEETKAKIHEFIITTFQGNARSDFTETASRIFKNVNQKVKDDMLNKNSKMEYSTASAVPDMSNVFVNPMAKSPEQLEAENVLREIFEREIVEFNEQIKKDFEQLQLQLGQEVNTVMDTVCKNVQFAQVTFLIFNFTYMIVAVF